MQGREYDPALTVSNTGPDKSQPEPLWHVKTRTDARGLHFYEVGTKDGSHYITVSGNQRWMSRSEPAATRLAAKANLVLVEAVLTAGEIDPEPEWRIEAGAEAQAAAEAAGFATVEEWHNAPGWHDVSEHQPGPDPEPQPGDGPDYHAEHAAWVARHQHHWTYDGSREVCRGCGSWKETQ